MKPNDKIIEEKISKTWEVEFDKKFTYPIVFERRGFDGEIQTEGLSAGVEVSELKDFIRQLLSQKKVEWQREMVEDLKLWQSRTLKIYPSAKERQAWAMGVCDTIDQLKLLLKTL